MVKVLKLGFYFSSKSLFNHKIIFVACLNLAKVVIRAIFPETIVLKSSIHACLMLCVFLSIHYNLYNS